MSDTDTDTVEIEQAEEPDKYVVNDDGSIEIIDLDLVEEYVLIARDVHAYKETLKIATKALAEQISDADGQRQAWFARVYEDLGLDEFDVYFAHPNLSGTKIFMKKRDRMKHLGA